MTKKYFTRLLQASLMCCMAVIFTACDDMFATEDNPTSAYLGMSDKPVTIKVGETFLRQATTTSTAVIEYTSSDTKIATVDNTGLVTAIAEGETTITATVTGYSSQTGKKIYLPDSKSYKLTVKPAAPPATITTAPVATAATIFAGSATDLVTAGVADGGTMMYRVTPANEAKPTSTDGFSADIPSASTRAAGTYSVWYYAKGDATHSNSKIAGPVEVTLQDGVAVTGVTLDKAVLRIDKYTETATLTATVSPADATDKTVTWKSSDETVVTVDASGKITPKKAGTVTIKATAGDKTATSTIYVYDMIYNSNSYGLIEVPTGKSYMLTGNGNTSSTKIDILDGATVTLNGINVSKQIECKGNATIILADGSTNTVNVSTDSQAGIVVGGSGKTLTIDAETEGTGQLTVQGGNGGAGIGTNGSYTYTCGDITISGGTVNATGGIGAAGIGNGATDSGVILTCGNITIGAGVTSVTACGGSSIGYLGSGSPIGMGGNDSNDPGTQVCGTITFGSTQVFDGTTWSPSDPLAADTYGGLTLAISGNTWTLTPAN